MKQVKSLKILVLFFLSLLISACGSDSEKVQNAIDEANFLLNQENCTGARKVLDEVGYQRNNARYIAVYSTTYACEANFTTVNFFANDLGDLNTTTGGIFGSLASFSTSSLMTSAEDLDFTKLQQAINTILYSGGQSDSASSTRIGLFGATQAAALHTQAVYMVLVNLGRWLRYHGNANASGAKGQGTNTENNNCLYSYDVANGLIETALDNLAATNPCYRNILSGNPPPTATTDMTKEKLCNGIVLFNNFIDIIINITFSGSNSGGLNNLGAAFDNLCTDLSIPADQCLISLKDLDECKAVADDAAGFINLQLYSILVFESNFP